MRVNTIYIYIYYQKYALIWIKAHMKDKESLQKLIKEQMIEPLPIYKGDPYIGTVPQRIYNIKQLITP